MTGCLKQRYIVIAITLGIIVYVFVFNGLPNFSTETTKALITRGSHQGPLSLPTIGSEDDIEGKTKLHTWDWFLPFRDISATRRVVSPSDTVNCVQKPLYLDQEIALKAWNEVKDQRLAFVWYAASLPYLCSSLTAFKTLKALKAKRQLLPIVDYVLIFTESDYETLGNDKEYIKVIEQWRGEGGLVRNESSLSHFIQSPGNYYKSVYNKFHAFKMIEYDRLVFMDADGMALNDLEHLFLVELPLHVRLAAPQAYWFKLNGITPTSSDLCPDGAFVFVTTALMVIEPSLELFERLKRHLGTRHPGSNSYLYDMDIVNKEFACTDEILVLPKHYGTLDSEFNVLESLHQRVKECSSVLDTQYMHFTSRGKPWTRSKEVNHFLYANYFVSNLQLKMRDWFRVSQNTC